jgi:membrane peptidoglycan carboxypeptidase
MDKGAKAEATLALFTCQFNHKKLGGTCSSRYNNHERNFIAYMAKRSSKRRVIRGGNRTFKERSQQFLGSFTSPNRFKRYWLNAEGAQRIGKIAAAGFVVVAVVFIYFAKDLPSPSKINARIGSQNTEFYDRTGQVKIWEVHGDKNRKVIEFNDMSPNIKNATVAIEDKDFYKHGAFSIFGIGRAFTGLIFRDPSKGGGSTITQQYVKNALLSPEYSYTRKIKELILSIEIEQLYKKDDILKLYLNEIPYGNQAYGIESACRTYFPHNLDGKAAGAKCASTLTLAQSSTLAAIPNLPTYYSPYGQHVDSLVERQHIILDRMVEQKMVSKDEANKARLDSSQPMVTALQQEIGLNDHPNIQTQVSDYPHFAQYAQEYLEDKLGPQAVQGGGLKVITTLDVDKQKMAQAAIDGPHGISAVRRAGGSNVAMVSADPKTGQVLAMIGSYNPNDANFGAYNVALANRQPGSSFKPFVYATLMKGNWGPGSTFYDVKTDFGGGYTPKNYSGTNYGVQSMRTALDGSLNIPAVKALYMAGVSKSIKTASDLGISTLDKPAGEYGLSLVLGSGEVKLNEMVNGYESFANGGMHYEATPVLKVTDPHNKTLMDNSKPQGKQALDKQISYLMANILSDDKSRQYIFGANNPLHINGRTVAAKTGTTENFNDAWTMGFSPDLVTGVWAGNNDNKPMRTEAVDIAAPIWHDYMAGGFRDAQGKMVSGALSSYDKNSNWTAPAGIQTLAIDAITGGAVTDATKQKRTDVFPSWYKVQAAGGVKTANVDKVSGKLATECTPPGAVQSVTGGQIHAEIPATDPMYNNWEPPVAALASSMGYASGGAIPTQNDDVHHCDDVKPTVSVSAVGNGPLHITAVVSSGTFPANNLTILFDDQVISTQAINGSTTYSFDYVPTSNGSHTIKATVTDAGLYSGSDETTVNVSNAGSGPGGPGGGAPFPGP